VNRKPKQQSSMVRAAVVAFVLLAGLVMVGAAGGAAGGAEDQDGPRSSVLMTVVEEGRPVPVAVEAPRKLSKHSKASQDDAVSKEVESLLGLLVFQTAVDRYRFSLQSARSLAEDETAAARADTNESDGRELRASSYEEYDCGRCLAFFAATPGLSPYFQREFCDDVSNAVGEKVGEKFRYYIREIMYFAKTGCLQLFRCASTTSRARTCCQSLGGTCLN